MLGMVGVGIGAFIPFRSLAMTSSVAFVAFYFVLLFMLQRLNLDYLMAALDAAEAATELTVGVANARVVLAVALTAFFELLLPLLLPYTLIRLVIRLLARQMRAN